MIRAIIPGQNKLHADFLRKIADDVESKQLPLTAVFVQLHWNDQTTTRFKDEREGFNYFQGIASCELMKAELIDSVRDNS